MSPGPVAEAVARVEAELSSFWATPDTSRGEPVAKARASTMSFVAVGSHADLERLQAQAEDLAETHAGRTFLVTVDGRMPPWDLRAESSATCRREGEVPICFDRVELTFGAMAAERAASVVGALALSDVPVVVEVGAAAPAVLADALVPACDRLIVDSAATPPARLTELLSRTRAPVADRAFVRTFSWRELTARFFDEAPSACRAIRRVEVARSAGAGPDPAALFIGWLGSRLGWRFESRALARDANGDAVELALVDGPEAPASEPRKLDAVRIRTSLEGEPLSLSIARAAGAEGSVCWTMAGARSAEHMHPLGRRDESWVLVKAIDSTEADRVLREALVAAAAWSAL